MTNQFTIDELQVLKNAIIYMRTYGGYNQPILKTTYDKVEDLQTQVSEELNAKLLAKKKMYQIDFDGIPPYAAK